MRGNEGNRPERDKGRERYRSEGQEACAHTTVAVKCLPCAPLR
jgi:hypothetical protein